jgi:7-alpha-hydroxysteroid dehydrogenase
VAERIASTGRRAHVVAADLNDTEAAAGLADSAMREFGRLDVVVNNVGGTIPCPLLDTSTEYLEEAFHFNVSTAHGLTRAAVPAMLDGERPGGAIVNISSIMGRLAGHGFLAYGTATRTASCPRRSAPRSAPRRPRAAPPCG